MSSTGRELAQHPGASTPGNLRQRLGRAWAWARLPRALRAEVRDDRRGLRFVDPGAARAVDIMGAWLLDSQIHSASADGGYARHFSPFDGWSVSYPETTGYIIPTLITLGHLRQDQRYGASARRALDWCRAIQFPEGGFQGGKIDAEPRVPVTFNTGQILLGLAAGVREFNDYHDACRRAGEWLATSQDADGCWRKHPTPFAKPGEKTYETHVAWGLFAAAQVLDAPELGAAGLRNISWALTKQRANGWFADCCLNRPEVPLTHTIGYTLRGLVEAYLYAPDVTVLAAAERSARALLTCIDEDGLLAGRYDADWRPAVDWVCLTGTVQIAACWFLLHRLTGHAPYRDAALRANRFVRRTLHVDGPDGWRGGVKGAYPFDGEYGRFEFLNWSAKFAIDANLMELGVFPSDLRPG